jgi:hypothetical protein
MLETPVAIPTVGANAANAPLCRRCRRVIAKCGIPDELGRIMRAQYTATVRRIMLLFAHESTPEVGLTAAKRPDNKAARAWNENGRALPGR